MRAAAEAALADHKAQREKASADATAANKAAEAAAAAEMASETNPWNTICALPPSVQALPAPPLACLAAATMLTAHHHRCVSVEQTRWSRSMSMPMCTPGTRDITICCSTSRSRARVPRRGRVSRQPNCLA